MRRALAAGALLVVAAGCADLTAPAPEVTPAPSAVREPPPAAASGAATSPSPTSGGPAKSPQELAAAPKTGAPRPPPPAPDLKQVAEAKSHLTAGLAAFKRGDYDAAEQECKEAMTLYPFLAQANLTVGKIFLIRGAAAKDYALIDSARLMFEMARALDPALREAEVLLELFRPGAE